VSGTNRRVVVLNTGSSSLKFAVYPTQAEAPPVMSGQVEGIGGSAHLKITGPAGKSTHD
jgi:acetate kinase